MPEPAEELAASAPILPKPASRPKSVSEYAAWAQSEIGDPITDQVRRAFKINSMAVLQTAQAHPFFSELDDFLRAVGIAYRDLRGTELLARQDPLALLKKPFDSVLEKCLRKNVVMNESFPSPPSDGWITTKNCVERLNDIVRGMLVCRYLDGPEYLATKLKARADDMGLKARYYSQQNERGYYAYHFYVRMPVEIVDLTLNASIMEVDIEIQLSTQLQDVLRDLTHGIYEQLRVTGPTRDETWKWDIQSNRFKASYLGHTLHLIEGLIVELRHDTVGKMKVVLDEK